VWSTPPKVQVCTRMCERGLKLHELLPDETAGPGFVAEFIITEFHVSRTRGARRSEEPLVHSSQGHPRNEITDVSEF
jgi:hypothetical protein